MITLLSILIVGVFTGLATHQFRYALAALPALSPLYLIRFSFGPFPTTLFELLILITLGVWLFSKPWTRTILSKKERMLFIVFALVICIGVFTASNTMSALGIAKAYYIEPILLYIAMRDRLRPQEIRFGLYALGVTAGFLALFGIFQWITGLGLAIPYDFTRRITSVFPYPNAYGLFVAPLITALATYGFLKRKYLPLALPGFLYLTLFLSETEAALVAIPATILLIAFFTTHTMREKISLGLMGIFGLCAALFIPSIRAKILLQDPSGLVRRSQWTETWELLKDAPLSGVGFNEYPSALIPYHTNTLYEIFQYPHNLILNAWVEAGILNIILVLLLLLVIVRALRGATRKNELLLACVAGLLVMFVHGLVDVPFYKNDLAVLTAFFFAGISITKINATNTRRISTKLAK